MNKNYYFFLPALAAIFSMKISAQAEIRRTEIPPMIKTEWGQQAPFYYKTPIINGEHAKTGCVATAMAQVINFHKYPIHGKPDIFSFDNFSFDFGNTTFEYSLMNDSYNETADEAEPSVQAVSTLMYACGVTVNMNYGVDSSSGNFSMIPSALNNWFLYPSEGMGLLLKDYFTTEEWEEIIYDELASGRPVLYMGGNGESSHVFVCDGYKDGKFHMNWGWYGEKNGYFSLSNLETERVVKEGVLSLNSSQRIIRGVRLEDETHPKPLATASNFSYDSLSDTFTLSGISCFENNTIIIPGIKLIGDGDSKEIILWSANERILNRNNSTLTYSLKLEGIDDGIYTIRPIYKLVSESSEQSNVYPVYCNILRTRYYTAEISSDKITACEEGSDIEINVSLSEYMPSSTFIKGENYGYGFTVLAENNGNTVITRFGISFCTPGTTSEIRNTNYNESLAPGESKIVRLGIPYTANPGEYDMLIYDNSSKKVLFEPINVTYHNSNEITTIEGSDYRYMPLSSDSDEAMILMPKTSTYNLENDVNVEIESSALINGKVYKITEIGPRLLYGRNDIDKLTIPSTIKKIDADAFAKCQNITKIKVNAPTPPVLHPSAFDSNVISAAKISVPSESIELYKSAPVWEGFIYDEETETENSLTIVPFSIEPESEASTEMTLVSNQDFYGCQFDLTLPEGLQLVTGGVCVSENLNGKNFHVTCSDIKNNNSHTILMYSSSHTPYPVGTIPILKLNFVADPDFEGGNITVSNVIFSTEDNDNTDKDVNFDSSTCYVSSDVTTSVSAIENLAISLFEIYNVSGIRVNVSVSLDEAVSNLTPGLYIIRYDNQSHKILIR